MRLCITISRSKLIILTKICFFLLLGTTSLEFNQKLKSKI